MAKPGAGFEPFTLRGPHGQSQREGRFFVGQPGEIAAFHHRGEATIRLGKLTKRQIDVEDACGVDSRGVARFVERHGDLFAAPLLAGPPPGVVDDDLTHGNRAHREKVAPIAPRGLRLVDQPEVGLVDQTSGIECLDATPAAELDTGEAPQVVVHEWDEPVQGARIAGAVGDEQLCNLSRQNVPYSGGWRDHAANGVYPSWSTILALVQIPGPNRRTPAAIAAALERGVRLPDGPGDRYAGYAVLNVRLASGEILALRRFPVTSVGTGYTSVWHRDANREWTLYSDVGKPHGCSRYFADTFSRSVVAPIRIDWRTPRSLVVEVDGGEMLKWRLDLAPSVATVVFNATAGYLPFPRSVLDFALKAGRLRLVDHVPDGIRVQALPQAVWTVNASRARLCGRDLGCLPDVASAGRVELWRPRRSLFAAGAMVIDGPEMADRSPGSRDPLK